MITLERYNQAYNPLLKLWLTARELDPNAVKHLPEYGYMAFEDGQPVAAGFLRRIEGGFGLLDSFVTDPGAKAEVRSQALDNIAKRLIDFSETLSISSLLCTTVDNNTKSRAIRHGFKVVPDTLLSRKSE